MKRLWLVPSIAAVVLFATSCANDEALKRSPVVGEAKSPTVEPAGQVGIVLTGKQFRALLTIQEVEAVLTEQVRLKQTQFLDIKKLTEERGDQQTFPLDSAYAIFFVNADDTKSIKLGILDLESSVAASNQYEEVKAMTTPELEVMEPPIGHASSQMVANAAGVGSNVVFLRSDLLVTLHTGMPEGAEPLTDIAGLIKLAKLIEGRLGRN